jgi:hypothetical protein
MLKDLNLETKIKNKVHELLDKNSYFEETATVTQIKFDDCTNSKSSLPQFFFDQDSETLECASNGKKAWSEHLKQKLQSFSRKTCKPWVKQRKQVPKPTKKTVQAALIEADEDVAPNEVPDIQSI